MVDRLRIGLAGSIVLAGFLTAQTQLEWRTQTEQRDRLAKVALEIVNTDEFRKLCSHVKSVTYHRDKLGRVDSSFIQAFEIEGVYTSDDLTALKAANKNLLGKRFDIWWSEDSFPGRDSSGNFRGTLEIREDIGPGNVDEWLKSL